MSRSKLTKMQLYAFESDMSKWEGETIYRLDIPAKWKSFILQFQKDKGLSIRVKPLGIKLQSLFPQIIWVNHKFYLDDSKPWLITTRPIATEMILLLAKGWFMQIAKSQEAPVPEEVIASELQWKEISLASAIQQEKGLIFSVLPALAAHQFCLTPKHLELTVTSETKLLQFSQVYASQQSECMSQPIPTKAGTFSYVVRFRLKTRGGEPNRYLLLVSAGIRRFVTKPQETRYLPGRINSTVLVSLDNPFLRKTEPDVRSYSSLSFRREGQVEPYTKWSTGLDELYFDVLWGKTFSSEEILKNPEKFVTNHNPTVLIVHNNRLFDPLWLEKGISIEEKMRFYGIVRDHLPEWKPLDPLPFVPKPKSETRGTRNKSKTPPMFFGHDKVFVLEIWGPDTLYDHVVEALNEKKYNGQHIAYMVEEGEYKLNAPSGNRLLLVKRDRKDFLDGLENDTYGELAHEHRVKKIAQTLEHVQKGNEITLSLIEILPKDNWLKTGEGLDPKLSVREGFRQTGRLSQFIYPQDAEKKSKRKQKTVDSNYLHRVFNGILDLIGDTGVIDCKAIGSIHDERSILAYDLVKVESGVYPILTKLERGELYVKGRGVEEWLPLVDAVFDCGAYDPIKNLQEHGKREVARWLDEQLGKERFRGKDLIVILEAELRTKGLVGIQNGMLKKDHNPPLSPWVEKDPGVTVIRVNSRDDVPAYGFDPISFSTGVYADGNTGLYYGVGKKAKTQKGIAKSMTKLYNPDVAFQQPRVVEYMPLGAIEEEERNRLAWMVHGLRELCITFESTTALPYPLKMMGTLKKYIKQKERSETNDEAEFLEF